MCEYLTAAFDRRNGQRLLAIDLGDILPSSDLKGSFNIWVKVDPRFSIHSLELAPETNSEETADLEDDELLFRNVPIAMNRVRKLTFYNSRAFIRLWIYRHEDGQITVTFERGTYKTLYRWERRTLGQRHGPGYSDFDDIPDVCGNPLEPDRSKRTPSHTPVRHHAA